MSEVDWTTGRVHVYTGDGKGKTTAALGLAIRAAGAGLGVYIGQFVKGLPYSEFNALERLADRITIRQFGRGCFLDHAPSDVDRAAARGGLSTTLSVLREAQHRLVVLDEINVAVKVGLFGVNAVLSLLEARPENVELVLTGRGAPLELMDRADLVTEMKEVKHYYRRGVEARLGIEK